VQDKDSPICTNKATVFPRGQSVFGEGEVIVQEERLCRVFKHEGHFQTRINNSNFYSKARKHRTETRGVQALHEGLNAELTPLSGKGHF